MKSFLRAATVLTVLASALAAQAAGGPPVTPEGAQAYRDYGRAMAAGQQRANAAHAHLDQVEGRIGDRIKAGKYVTKADRKSLEQARAQYTGAQREMAETRQAGLKPFLPAKIVVAPAQPSREEIIKDQRFGAYDERRTASLPGERARGTVAPTRAGLSGDDARAALHKMSMASTSLGEEGLEHIFPGSFEVRTPSGGRTTITGYRQRLDYLLEELTTLDKTLSRTGDAPKVLADFRARNGAWIDRYSDAIAARQLMFDRNAARRTNPSLKFLSESEALGVIAKKPASIKTAAIKRWFESIGGDTGTGLGILGVGEE